jgi:hypothetical protein
MKAAFILAGSLLAFSAHAGPVAHFQNAGGGATILYEEANGCPEGLRYLQGQLGSGWAYKGCWYVHGDTVVMHLSRGRDSGAQVQPISQVEWAEGKKPVAAKRRDI